MATWHRCATTIGGGTSQMLRNLIGHTVLQSGKTR